MSLNIDSKTKKMCNFFLIACFALYSISIAAKSAYAAQMVAIIDTFGCTKAEVSLGLTIYYSIYAVFQAILAVYIKRMNVRRFLFITLLGATVSFGVIVFVKVLWQIWIIMGLIGICQSGIWISCLYFLGKYTPDSFSPRVTKVMSFGFAFGNAAAYGAGALFTSVLSWKYTFLFFSVLTAATLFLFLAAERKIRKFVGERTFDKEEEKVDAESVNTSNPKPKKKGFIMVYLFILSLFLSSTYWLLSNWIPSLFTDVYGIDKSYSILISILLPICIMFGPFLTTYSATKHENYFSVMMFYVLSVIVCPIALCFVYNVNLILAFALSLIFLFITNGLRNLIGTYLPLKLKHTFDAGKSGAILNVAASASAALMPVIGGSAIEVLGWSTLYILVAALCAVIILLLLPMAIKNKNKKPEIAASEIAEDKKEENIAETK